MSRMPFVICIWLLFDLLGATEVPAKIRDPVACSIDSMPLELTDYSGWFSSPEYPDMYPNSANCQWLIRSQEPGGVVVLDFTFLAVEAGYDAIEIYDGPSLLAPKIAGFDGTWNPSLPTGVRSTSDSVLFRFYSDDTVRGRGFNVSYTSDVLTTQRNPCYPLSRPQLVTDYSGSFQTNNYPSQYWNYAECAWLIESQEISGRVQISFTYFSTAGSGDVLYLHDGSNAQAPLLATITGAYGLNTASLRYTTNQGYMFARFVTDATGVDRGFNAAFTSLPPSN